MAKIRALPYSTESDTASKLKSKYKPQPHVYTTRSLVLTCPQACITVAQAWALWIIGLVDRLRHGREVSS